VSIPLFLVLAALTIASALVVVVHRNPVYSALGLVGTLFLLSVFFVGLDAHMVAVLQVIVYAGAIVVLFLFVITLLNLQVEERSAAPPPMIAVAVAGAVGLGGLVLAAIVRTTLGAPVPVHTSFGGTEPLAERLFTVWLCRSSSPRCRCSVAIVGAVVVGGRRSAMGDAIAWYSPERVLFAIGTVGVLTRRT
jgi:NADH-quinone oxidoreductase subunit J